MVKQPPNVKAIFDQALELATAAERQAFLDQACADTPALREKVELLLRAYEDAGSFLEAPGVVAATIDGPITESPGAIIGPYKLLEQIGEGGFGVVFMAEQQEPIRRRVALKILKPGMDTHQVVARFEAERQALALMDHVNIARVIDGGETASGRPYFVMELVRGAPITAYCDQVRMSPRERLELFATVCQAIQHAHQKGIIHRDVKPSNVLVTQQDGKPLVKVIDFGVAKATGQQLTEKTLFTNFAQMIGTPLYMSPEQAGMSTADVDTRSDIYSLGVLLYELLTGTTPFDKERLKKSAYDEIRRIIREEEPPKPSTRLSESKDSLPSISAQRQTEPAKLTKLVRGELDWIVMKALEKDRSRRYETANGFAMDVQRYLADEPVLARTPSKWYRIKKTARRNKAALMTAALVAGALVLGLGISTWQWWRAENNAEEAIAKQRLADQNFERAFAAVGDSFTQVSESKLLNKPGLQPLRRDLLQSALRYYQEFTQHYGDDPRLRVELIKAHSRVGQIEFLIGSPESARDAFSKAIATLDNHAGEAPTAEQQAERAELETHLGGVYHALGDRSQALATLEKAVSSGERLVAACPSAADFRAGLAKSYGLLGVVHRTTGRRDLQSEAYKKALALLEQLHREQPRREAYRSGLASAYANIAVAHFDASEDQAALGDFQKAGALLEGLVADYPEVTEHLSALVSVQQRQGIIHARLGQLEEAVGVLGRTLPLQQRLAAENPSVVQYQYDLAIALQTLGTMRAQLRKWPEAEAALQEAIATQRRLVAAQPKVREYAVFLSLTYATLAGIKKNSGAPEAALEWYDQAIQALHGVLAHEAQNARAKDHLWWCHARRADTLDQLHRFNDAIKDWGQALAHADDKRLDALLAQQARSRAWTGDHQGALSQVQPLLNKEQLSGETQYHVAGVFAVSAEAAKNDARLPENQRTTLAEAHAQRALDLLRSAIAAGYADFGHLRKDPSFESLRSRREFQGLFIPKP